MSVNSSGRRKLKKIIYAASTLMLAAAVILFWGSGKGSHAQQAPGRQLEQNGFDESEHRQTDRPGNR